jgi:hypothetical protein
VKNGVKGRKKRKTDLSKDRRKFGMKESIEVVKGIIKKYK